MASSNPVGTTPGSVPENSAAASSAANGPTNTTSNPALTSAQASSGYQSPLGGSTTSTATQQLIPTKQMTLSELAQQEGYNNPNIETAPLPSSPKGATTTAYTTHTDDARTLLNSLASHFNIKVKTGQNLTNEVIVALDKHYGINQGGGKPKPGGRASLVQGAEMHGNVLNEPATKPIVTPEDVGRALELPGQAIESAGKELGAGTKSALSPAPGSRFGGKPGAGQAGAAIEPKGKGKGNKNGPLSSQQDSISRETLQGEPSPKGPNQTNDGLTIQQSKAIAAIAKKAGIGGNDPGKQLAAMAKDLGAPAVQSPSQKAAQALAHTAGQTTAEAYTNFTKDITANPKQLASWSLALQRAGLLDPNQGTDSAAVSNAYGKLLIDSVQANQAPDQVIMQKERDSQNLQANSPSSEIAAGIQSTAQAYGVNITPDQVGQIVSQYPAGTSFGSVEDEIKNQIVALFDPSQLSDPNTPQGGIIGTAIQDVKAMADQYQVPMSDLAIGNIIKQALISTGVNSANFAVESAKGEIQQMLENQAASLYPSIAPQIQNGYTVKDITSPYDQLTQQYTGKDAASILHSGPADPFSAFLQGSKDPKTGQPSMMTLDQWKQQLMSNPVYGFQKTQGAKNMAADFTSSLLSTFGAAPTGAGTSFSGYSGTPGTANT